MSRVYSAKAVANRFIQIGLEDGCRDMTPLKLQKLVYLAHAWNLAFTGEPLIKEEIQARPYGPVVPELVTGGGALISSFPKSPDSTPVPFMLGWVILGLGALMAPLSRALVWLYYKHVAETPTTE